MHFHDNLDAEEKAMVTSHDILGQDLLYMGWTGPVIFALTNEVGTQTNVYSTPQAHTDYSHWDSGHNDTPHGDSGCV